MRGLVGGTLSFGFGFVDWVRRDFGGNVFFDTQVVSTLPSGLVGMVMCVLVKNVTKKADQNLIKLESLILAQNERWRQA